MNEKKPHVEDLIPGRMYRFYFNNHNLVETIKGRFIRIDGTMMHDKKHNALTIIIEVRPPTKIPIKWNTVIEVKELNNV